MKNRNIDTHKLHFHPTRVSQVLQATDWNSAKEVYPLTLEISLCSHCNSRCRFCALDFTGFSKAELDYDILAARLKEMGELGVKSIHYAGEGEPMLHSRINEAVAATKASNIDVAFTSNGTMMNNRFVQESLKNVSWIKISLNAGTAETYAKVHRVKEAEFYKVIENIKYALWYKKEHGLKCDIGIQSVMLPENAHEMETLAELCRNMGVDYFVVKQFNPSGMMLNKQYDSINYQNYLNIAERVNALATDDFEVVFRLNAMKDGDYSQCMSVPFIWGYVATSGKFLACSAHFLEERFDLGNIYEQTFAEIWQGPKREALFREGINIDECRKGCRMANCNQYLDSVKNNKTHNGNFI